LTRDDQPVAFAVAPQSLDEAWRWAQAAALSTLVPKDYRNRPADILVAVQMGVEIGLPPMTALQSIAVINGRPGVFGDGVPALVMTSPLYGGHDQFYEVLNPHYADAAIDAPPDATAPVMYQRVEVVGAADLQDDATRAVCVFERLRTRDATDRPRVFRATFSIADAKRAGLWTKEGPWQTYPARMLAWRALGFAARAAFPDVLKGLRTVEELRDIPPDADPPPPAPRVVSRKSAALEAGHHDDTDPG
jgi:hypothetical protein